MAGGADWAQVAGIGLALLLGAAVAAGEARWLFPKASAPWEVIDARYVGARARDIC